MTLSNCLRCGVDTFKIDEYYMLEHYIWRQITNTPEPQPKARGMMCIGCVEEALGRKLTAIDFMACSCNTEFAIRSRRLQDRLTNVSED